MRKITAKYLLSATSRQLSARKAESRKLKTESLQPGFSSLAFITTLGLVLAILLTLVGTGALKLPGNAGIPVSPFPVSDPVEDDQACNDPYNADCEKYLENDPEDLSSKQIQKELEN